MRSRLKHYQPIHNVGVKIIKPDGSVYVFGETAYNTQKIEATFALGVNPSFENDDCSKEIAKYANNFTISIN